MDDSRERPPDSRLDRPRRGLMPPDTRLDTLRRVSALAEIWGVMLSERLSTVSMARRLADTTAAEERRATRRVVFFFFSTVFFAR